MKYIDSKTYEIIDDESFFEVDDDIAESISLLNKKGYKTTFSCAGHNNSSSCYKLTYPIKSYDEMVKNKEYIGEVRKEDFDCFYDYYDTYLYVCFDKHYDFPNLPEGFNYETSSDRQKEFSEYVKDDNTYGDKLEKCIYFYDGNVKRDDKVIEYEIKQENRVLLEWVKSLPNYDVAINK